MAVNIPHGGYINIPIATTQEAIDMASDNVVMTPYKMGLCMAAMRAQSAASRSLTASTGAAGFQVSSTRDSWSCYSVSLSTTATIGGASAVSVALEICPTNSATPANWIEIGRVQNNQAITLAVILQSVQVITQQLQGYIPAGFFAKLRTLGTSGTQSSSFVSGQEVFL